MLPILIYLIHLFNVISFTHLTTHKQKASLRNIKKRAIVNFMEGGIETTFVLSNLAN